MSAKFSFSFILVVFFNCPLKSQNISGYIKDAGTNEPLIGVTILYENNNKAVVSNNYGFYTLRTKKDSVCHLTIYYAGYKKIDTALIVSGNTRLSFNLKAVTLQEVEVKADLPPSSNQVLTSEDIKKVPVFFGEPDLMKAFQLQPGVKQGAEGFSSLLIRGGTADQVQYILDDMPLYYVNHMGGFISTFNTEAISRAELYKNHTPAIFSGRLSGVMDVRSKEGNADKWHGSLSTGVISTRLSFNGPVIKNKSTLTVSARCLNLGLFTTPILYLAKSLDVPSYFFYDGLLKYTHRLNAKNKFSVTIFRSADNINLYSKSPGKHDYSDISFKYGWTSNAAALRLMQALNSRLFLTHVISGSMYGYNLDLRYRSFENDKQSQLSQNTLNMNLKDVFAKSTAEYRIANNLKLIAGMSYEFLQSNLGKQTSIYKYINYNSNDVFNGTNTQSGQWNTFASIDLTLGRKLKLSLGANNLLFNSGTLTKNYLQPRLLAQYTMNDKNSFSISYCQNVQALHLLTNNGIGMPTDIWVPADDVAPPQLAQQLNLNYTHYFSQHKYSLQADVYYKQSSNLIRYKNSFNLFNTKNNWHDHIEKNGTGLSYGLEVLFKKEVGKLTGFVAYTLSKTTNQFANLNNGKPFYFNYDRRHQLNVFANYQLTERIAINATFLFATGNAITLPTGVYKVPYPNNQPPNYYSLSDPNSGTDVNNYAFYYDGINTQRTSNFNRLDMAASFTKQKKKGLRTWSFGIYNLYNHHNPFAYSYSYKIVKSEFVLKSISVFQLTPFFSYDFKF